MPVIRDFTDNDIRGTMGVVDLWPDKNIMKFLGNCKMLRDKYSLLKIASIK